MLSKKLPLAAAAAVAALFALPALAQMKVGVVTSSTGPTALVGIPQKNTVPLLPKKIGDLTVEYISLDDASDSTNSVTAFKKLISEQNVDALIGPSGSPNAMGVIQFAAEAGVPMLAPVGTAAAISQPAPRCRSTALLIRPRPDARPGRHRPGSACRTAWPPGPGPPPPPAA